MHEGPRALQWAMIQNNIGKYRFPGSEEGDDVGRLKQAMAAFQEALKESTRDRVPLQWAVTQNDVGMHF